MARTGPRAPTPSQTVGPFFGFAMPFGSDADAVAPGSHGAIRVEGQMLDGAGDPVPDGLIEVWGEDQFARCRTDAEGAFHVTVRKPAARPGIDGRTQAPYLNVTVFARGLLRHLATRVYFPDEEEANRLDPILERVPADRRNSLIAHRGDGALRFDIRLQGEGETVFFAL
jgi:protocatechuate 3,4-dioxygenase alpha subunit